MIARAAWWGVSLAVLLFLLLPVLVVIPLSFSTSSFAGFPIPGFGLRWYQSFAASAGWRTGLVNSLLVGLAATLAATCLGTLAALGLWRARWPGRGLAMAVILAPMVVPSVTTGVALTFAFAPLGLANTLAGLAAAHAALAAPFVVVTVLASLARLDPLLLRAAAASGAPPAAAFRRVTLPLIAPGIAAGAIFAFATSLDESVVVQFLAGPGQQTLPRQMFAVAREGLDLTILAAATLLIGVAALLMIATALLRRV